MFVGRENELGLLRELTELPKASLVICRGRRRIGKSTLINQFGKDFPRFFQFQGLPPRPGQTWRDQLTAFAQAISAAFDFPKMEFQNWHEAFTFLAKQTSKGRTLIFLDEISWLADGDPDFAGRLKIAWDTQFKNNPDLILVLCGSVTSWLDRNILHGAGFMGRVSLTITLSDLPLHVCNLFWGNRAARVSSMEKFKVLSVTGGVPRYLEEIDPRKTAEVNLRNLCFRPSGVLFREFNLIFDDIFQRRAPIYKSIVEQLAGGPKSFTEVCKGLGREQSGTISEYLQDLETAGFLRRFYVHSLATGKETKLNKYWLTDSYLRFYLKYIEPRQKALESALQEPPVLENLPGFNTVMGLQFESLVYHQIPQLCRLLEIPSESILSAAPYFQNRTARQEACQIDLLIRTRRTIYVCEIKFQMSIPHSVIGELDNKMQCLKTPKGTSVRPVLIHAGELADSIPSEDYFDAMIPFDRFLDWNCCAGLKIDESTAKKTPRSR